VPDSRPLEPGTTAAFYSRLPAAVNDLDAARTKGMRELAAAKRSTGQAAAADGLARAHKAAGAALAPLTARSNEEGGDEAPVPIDVESAGKTADALRSRTLWVSSIPRVDDPRANDSRQPLQPGHQPGAKHQPASYSAARSWSASRAAWRALAASGPST
jgi:hypothetical protein